LAGGETALPCSLEDKEKGDSVYLVLWYRREDRTPIYSYDSRYEHVQHVHGFILWYRTIVYSHNSRYLDLYYGTTIYCLNSRYLVLWYRTTIYSYDTGTGLPYTAITAGT
jgi:hypothetical protein